MRRIGIVQVRYLYDKGFCLEDISLIIFQELHVKKKFLILFSVKRVIVPWHIAHLDVFLDLVVFGKNVHVWKLKGFTSNKTY